MNSQQSPAFPPQPNSSYTPTISTPSATTTTTTTNTNHPMMTTQNPGFPFNTIPTSTPKPHFDYIDGSSPSSGFGPSGFTIDPTRKKRGRPRKYSTPNGGNGNGNSATALALAPTPVSAVGHADSGRGGGGMHSSDKRKGRPSGSGKKQLDALGASGVGFTPHVIVVNAGEDIASKIMAFSQQGPRTVCILSASGAICNVTLRQPAMSGGTVTYEGRFEILSLTGSYVMSESNGSRSRTGGLSVSLAGSDGGVFGGGVAGMLMAATSVQVIVGSFIAEGKKPKSGPSPATPSNVLNFGAPVAGPGTSPPFQGASSESSDEIGDGRDGPLNHGSGPYNNANQQPLQGMPMYTNIGWANTAMKFPD